MRADERELLVFSRGRDHCRQRRVQVIDAREGPLRPCALGHPGRAFVDAGERLDELRLIEPIQFGNLQHAGQNSSGCSGISESSGTDSGPCSAGASSTCSSKEASSFFTALTRLEIGCTRNASSGYGAIKSVTSLVERSSQRA